MRLLGHIANASDSSSLAGANVVLPTLNKGTATEEDGSFTFTGIPTGRVRMKVSYIGFSDLDTVISVADSRLVTIYLHPRPYFTEAAIVRATRFTENSPATFTNITKEEIEEEYVARDVPFLLNMTPSVVATSDAGNAIGYTGIRIRGMDISRVNVTINGIPVNDAESHGVFFVDMPDIASSMENVQIQRGVGTSTNGAAAFGSSVNIQTQLVDTQAYAEVNTAVGSYNTWKANAILNTGKLGNGWAFNARLSKMQSDGYIDRASSDLSSYYVSGGYFGDKNILKLVHFSGHEETYQAWCGVPEDSLETNRTFNMCGTDYGSVTDPYENEVDNYRQDYYQAHYTRQWSPNLLSNASLFLTRGIGYYEEFRAADSLTGYGFHPLILGDTARGFDTVTATDLIRRQWLDNYYYGAVASVTYEPNSDFNFSMGGSYTRYDGDHYGDIIWAEYAEGIPINERWYFNDGNKQDVNVYAKSLFRITTGLRGFADLQYRHITHTFSGTNDDLTTIGQDLEYNFINPKVGLMWQPLEKHNIYGYFGISNREPTRTDFIESVPTVPEPEQVYDVEAGWKYSGRNFGLVANLYYMAFRNQLVQTGEVNDVGTYIRRNIDQSYRRGIELSSRIRPLEWLDWNMNISLSQNRISKFSEVVYTYDEAYNVVDTATLVHTNVPISFSPSIVAASQLEVMPMENLSLELETKYVSKQFLDNTGSEERSIPQYLVNNLRIGYFIQPRQFVERIRLTLTVNNILDELYVANGYTYRDRYSTAGEAGPINHYNYYYPMAERNFLLGLTMRF